MIQRITKQAWHITIAALCAIAIFMLYRAAPHASAFDASAEAKSIVAQCATGTGDHAPCYEDTVPALYPNFSVPQIFDIVRAIRRDDPSYQFCHVLAHKLGERVVAEDPSQWLDAIPLNPTDGSCSNGFIHGVIIGRFNTGVLDDATLTEFMPDFKKACEPRTGWQPSPLDQGMCYHGMGHLFDYVTNADLPKALSLCNEVAASPTGDFTQVCFEGVFMQIFQPLEPEDFDLIARLPTKPTASNIKTFCSAYRDPRYQSACLQESWPLFRDGIISGTGAGAFCGMQTAADGESRCYDAISSVVGRLLLNSSDKVVSACDNFPAKWQSVCFGSSAAAALEEDRDDASTAVALCAKAEPVVGESCIETLVDRAAFTFGDNTAARDALCRLVPPYLQEKCFAQ